MPAPALYRREGRNARHRAYRAKHKSTTMLLAHADHADWRAMRRIARALGLSLGETLTLAYPLLRRRAIRAGLDPDVLAGKPAKAARKGAPPPKETPRVKEYKAR